MEFLLPKGQLKGLSEEDQKAAKDEAFNQFLLGSIFGGGGISTGYQAVQNIIPNLQKQRQQQGLLSELQGIQKDFFPTEQETQSQALNANLGRPRQASSPYALGTSLGLPQDRVEPQATQGEAPNYADMQTRLARLSLNPNAASMIPALSSSFGAFKPNVTDGVVTDIRNRPTSVIPRMDTKTGLQFGGNVQNGNVNFNATDIAGFADASARNQLPPLTAGTRFTFDEFGRRTGITSDVGAVASTEALEGAKARGQASGQVEPVIGADGKTYYVPRSALLNQPPRAGGAGTTPPVGGSLGAVAKISPEQATLDAAANERFLSFSKKALESADSASGRKIAAEQLYDLATQVNNNKLTGLQAGIAGYMNAIPGVGKLFEQDITDVTRMTQMIKTAQLEKTAMQKGAASNLDATTIEKSYASITDPASSTRMAAAFEVALADKDVAKNQFVEAYTGNPGKASTAWQNSPDNKPLFNHPKFDQFLSEQVNTWAKGGAQGKPVLPAGFQFGTGKTSNSYMIKKPDGTIYRIGQ
jgi:hypothetical protein